MMYYLIYIDIVIFSKRVKVGININPLNASVALI